jgi:hypothetical protein
MVMKLSRSEFLDEYFQYQPGEHVSLIQPTGGGKTHLAYQLVDRILDEYPQLRFGSLMPKAKDDTTVRFMRQLGLRESSVWPPRKKWPWEPEPRGYVFWPRHDKSLSAEKNRERLADKFRQMLNDQFWSENTLTLADDVYVLAALMNLNPELEQLWTAGRTMPAGLISCNQKPSGTLAGTVSSHSYSSPTHFFFGKDGNQANRARFAEIACGLDPHMISGIVRDLNIYRINGNPVSEQLYLDRRGPYMTIVGP